MQDIMGLEVGHASRGVHAHLQQGACVQVHNVVPHMTPQMC